MRSMILTICWAGVSSSKFIRSVSRGLSGSSASAQDVALVVSHDIEPAEAGGDALPLAVVFPHRSPRHRLLLLENGEARRVVPSPLGVGQARRGLQQRPQDRLAHVAGADHPGGDAVDARIEEVEPERDPIEHAAADDLVGDGLGLVVQQHHVIAVPTHAAAELEEDVIHEAQGGRQLVGYDFGGVEVPGVQAQHDLPAGRVRQVELVGADRVALGADPEELALHGVPVELAGDRDRDHLVQRLDQAPSRAEAVVRLVLGTVRDPDVHDRWRAQRPAEMSADAAARLAMVDPEAADRPIGMAERHVLLALRVREAGGVEVEPDPPLLRPVDPALEVLRPDLAALDGAVRFQVDRVQVEALGPRDLGHRHLHVGAQLVRVPGAPRIVAGALDSSRQGALRVLEPPHVVSLPAMQGNGNAIEAGQRRLRVDADGRERFARQRIRAFNVGMPGHDRVLSFANDWNLSQTASGTASPGRNSSSAYDCRTSARASASERSTPRAMSWPHAFPRAVVSTGPALTGSRQASAQSWSSSRFWQPPPTMWMRDRGRPRRVSNSSFTCR